MISFISSLNRGTPKVSVACDSERPSASLFLLPLWSSSYQCRANSFLVIAFLTAESDYLEIPAAVNSPRLALMRSFHVMGFPLINTTREPTHECCI